MPRLYLAFLVALTTIVVASSPGTGSAQSDDEWSIVELGGAPGAPVATNAGVELLYLYALVTPNWISIRGELQNTTDRPVAVPKVTVTLRDSAGQAVEEKPLIGPFSPAPAAVYQIRPGDRFGVSNSTQRPLAEWGSATAEIGDVTPIDQATLDAQASGLELFNVNEQARTDKSLDLLGEVRNTGATTATEIEVRIFFHLADGRYVGGATTDVLPATLAPGETGSFAHYQAPIVVEPDWTYTVEVVGLSSAETPPETGQGTGEIAADAEYTGQPPIARTGVELSYLYASADGWLTFYGELRNTTGQPLALPDVAVTFYDAQGHVANSRLADSPFSIIPPGETAPIAIFTTLAEGSWQRAVVNLGPSGPADLDRVAEGLTVVNVTAEETPDHLRLTGDVVNGGDQGADRIAIHVLFYDARGRYAGDETAFTDSMAPLAPGQRDGFSFDEDVDLEPGWTYRLEVEGRPAR
jgi:hypothetical protein